jgi:predicted transposase/invertase (TIGR01784 family)
MTQKIGIRPWIDFAFRKIFGKPGNEICLISLLNSILDLPHAIQSVSFQNPLSLKEFQDEKLVCVDVKASDQVGRVFVVEIQIIVHASFAKRAVYYACSAYTDQLRQGQGYSDLKATYCVCLLMRNLWDDRQLHHHFRLVEHETGSAIEESIEIHTIELSKYNGIGRDLLNADLLEQWCYWIKNADDHTPEELSEMLPGLAFLRATSELQAIQEKTEEKEMYDSREKALMDYEANLIDARKEEREKAEALGIEKGEANGMVKGRIQLLQELLELPISTKEELDVLPLEQLTAMMNLLRAKLRDLDV